MIRYIRTLAAPRRSGFTLIELIVVIVVLGLLAGLVAPAIFGRVSDAKLLAARTQMEMLSAALDGYRLDVGRYPTTEQGLRALIERPTSSPTPASWRGPYLRKGLPDDPWGRPYIYTSPGNRSPTGFDLSTLGRDGVVGGEGEDADIIAQ